MKKLFAMLSIVALTLGLVACSNNNSPEAVVDAYMAAVKKGDVKTALDLMYFEKEMSQEDRAELEQMFNDKLKMVNDNYGGIASYEIGEATMDEDGNHATVPCKTFYANGEDEDGKQKTVNVNDKWYIDSGK